MPITLVAAILFAFFKGRAGLLILGTGGFLGALVRGWVSTLPVDFSAGYPINLPSGYIDGGMVELVIWLLSIATAVIVQLAVSFVRRLRAQKQTQ